LEITFPFEGAFISAFDLGFNTTLEHKEPFYRHLPQYQTWQAPYPSGPWLTGISGIPCSNYYFFSPTASKNFFLSAAGFTASFYLHPLFAVSCF
jgi:hypothetical protein